MRDSESEEIIFANYGFRCLKRNHAATTDIAWQHCCIVNVLTEILKQFMMRGGFSLTFSIHFVQ